MSAVLAFWAAAILIGILTVPLSVRLFRRFIDAGIGFSIPLGLIVLSATWFLLRVIGIPNGVGSLAILLFFFAVLSFLIARTDRHFVLVLRRAGPFGLCTFGVFNIAFFAYVIFRSFTPEIAHTEQPMDLMMLNAVVESPSYPPHDPWFAGESLSYYYGGFIQAGLLILLTDIPTSIGYNLALALAFAGSVTTVFSLVATLFRWLVQKFSASAFFLTSLLGITLLLFTGSLAGFIEFLSVHINLPDKFLGTLGLHSLTDAFSTTWYPTEFWFWWRATRLIPETIIEFPAFSFLLGDLHPHLMSIPGVILSLAVASSLWRSRGILSFRTHLRDPIIGFLLALIMGSLAFVNAWDIVTFNAAIVITAIAHNLKSDFTYSSCLKIFGWLIPVMFLSVAIYGSWYATFSTQAGGIAPYMGPGSNLEQMILLNGPLLLAMTPLIFFAIRSVPKISLRVFAIAGVVPVIPFIVWLAVLNSSIFEISRTASGWATIAFEGVLLWGFTYALIIFLQNKWFVMALLASLAILSTLLCYGAEFFYVQDVFEEIHPRSNTVFKLLYQSWIVSSVVGAVSLSEAFRRLQGYRLLQPIFAVVVASLVVVSLTYIAISIPNRINENVGSPTIDGLAYVDANDRAVIQWLQENVKKSAIIVEASGRTWVRNNEGELEISSHRIDYTLAGRVAARTGLQSPIGWPGHEIQWRPSQDAREEIERRLNLVDEIYLASDSEEALAILRELGANYLVVSGLERVSYPDNFLLHFDAILTLVFGDNTGLDARIYSIPVKE
ncbi:MAG: DUF2298 domain-containing protein [Tepidiformaceae bacterium]